ncbi:MAG: amidase [Armatimonadota bacterium]|nr:amidase [Armatimonadota bacterium]
MSEITRLSVTALAEAVRALRLSPTEIVEGYLARIAEVDPVVEAYVLVLADRARADAAARAAEQRAGRFRGPLHGVPVAVKDLMTVQGAPMTAGSVMLGREPADEDAAVVRRLREAGAVILGLTTLNEFALGTTGVNPHSRTARNPWNLERMTGGSSSGSAAAVAAGLAPAAIGTDTGGSIRIPAALCGIVGLKPTFGRVSRRGVFPLAASFDTVGPMTRTVEDAALLLEAIAGHDVADPDSDPAPVAPYRDEMRRDPAGMTVGRLSGAFFDADLDPAVVRGLDATARALESAGVRVRPVTLPSVDAAHDAQLVVLRYEAAALHRNQFPGREAEYNPDVRALLEQGASVTPAAVEEAWDVLARFRASVAEVLAETPVLLCPAVPVGAPRIADADPGGALWPEIRRLVGRFTRIFNATGLPAITLPVSVTADGLPVAVQMAARPFAEGWLLSVARLVEAAVGWSMPDLPARR